MSYDDGLINIELSEEDISYAQRIVIDGFINEGNYRARNFLIAELEKEVAEYLDDVDNEPNLDWVNGVRYAIHIIKEARDHGRSD